MNVAAQNKKPALLLGLLELLVAKVPDSVPTVIVEPELTLSELVTRKSETSPMESCIP